ncbi:arginine--tRNA ligase, partial [Bacteroidales bacterium OttesenSCG-928-B11]|nr:arginine--tRNA ligase [Bacteroidales bacterium OttesenSCG-928-C03]MDL2312211.1 arginine--tRNA ligase [Bacteroidales bacterium OttesenSCG-928-B11]
MIENNIAKALQESVKELYNLDIAVDSSTVQKTRKEFEGDFTIVVFPYVKAARKSPDQTANEIGDKLLEKLVDQGIAAFNVIKGFLNLSLSDKYWLNFFSSSSREENFGLENKQCNDLSLIEFSSPNTNKPLHLGHVRNILLGDSITRILKANGKKVLKVNLVNDRGIHICKSMLAWKKYGNGETPESSGLKGDHLVGKYYVEFDKHYKEEIASLTDENTSPEEAAKKSQLMKEAQEMLVKWENGDKEIRELWQMMNHWVYQGFNESYDRMGIQFDKTYYESDTYISGKGLVQKGLENGAFFNKKDNSVWVDLTDEGLDEKLLLRGDGTSVYMTQDLGTATMRYDEFHPQNMIYVVGNEQIYHFNVLKTILEKKLQHPAGKTIYHLSYGMVELPNGKMKSREGTVVDADDLMEGMYREAKTSTEALGKFNFPEDEAAKLYEMIGLGALKYFILKVDPKKNMLFNPEESIDFNGNTAPFIQYTHARIRSLLRKATENNINIETPILHYEFSPIEKELIKRLYEFPGTIKSAGEQYSPALIANYVYELAKDFNRFYQETPIFREENSDKQIFRLSLSRFIGNTVKCGMSLLGIDVP